MQKIIHPPIAAACKPTQNPKTLYNVHYLHHASAQATAANAAAATAAECPPLAAASVAPANGGASASARRQAAVSALDACSCCCSAVAAECASQVSRVCLALAKAGLGAAVSVPGVHGAISELLDGLVLHRLRQDGIVLQNSGDGVGALAEADGSHFRDCRTGVKGVGYWVPSMALHFTSSPPAGLCTASPLNERLLSPTGWAVHRFFPH